MKLFELFEKRIIEAISELSVVALGLGDVLTKADAELPTEAARAIDSFVGMPHDAIKAGYEFGIMSEHRLEDAYSDSPSPRGLQIRQEIETAFAPVKACLKDKFGNTVTLYRAQGKIDPSRAKLRHTLSWTTDLNVAKHMVGVGRAIAPITDAEIAQIVQTYEQTGTAKCGNYTYVRSDDPEYFDIYKDGQHVTDGDDLLSELKSVQQDQYDYQQRQRDALSNIIRAEVDIEAIIWVTNRANQSEFILKNSAGSSWHVAAR